jgi:hypothetical protein
MRRRLVHVALLAASASAVVAAPRTRAAEAIPGAATADALPASSTGAGLAASPGGAPALPPCLAALAAAADEVGTGARASPAARIPLDDLKGCYLSAVRPALLGGRNVDARAREAIRVGSEWSRIADLLTGDEELARDKWETRRKLVGVAVAAFWRAESRCSRQRDPTALKDEVEWARIALSLPAPGAFETAEVPDLDAVMSACGRFELRVASRVRYGRSSPGRDLDVRTDAVIPLVVERPRYDLLDGAGSFEYVASSSGSLVAAVGERRGRVRASAKLVLVDPATPPAPRAAAEAPPWSPRPIVKLELAPDDASRLAAPGWLTGFQVLHADAWQEGTRPPRFEVELTAGAPGGDAWASATTTSHLDVDAAHPVRAVDLDERLFGAWDGETTWTLVHTPRRLTRPGAEPEPETPPSPTDGQAIARPPG